MKKNINTSKVKFFPNDVVVAYSSKKQSIEFLIKRSKNKEYQSLFDGKKYPAGPLMEKFVDIPDIFDYATYLISSSDDRSIKQIHGGIARTVYGPQTISLPNNLFEKFEQTYSKTAITKLINACPLKFVDGTTYTYIIRKSVSLKTLLDIQKNNATWLKEENLEKAQADLEKAKSLQITNRLVKKQEGKFNKAIAKEQKQEKIIDEIIR